MPDFKGFIQDSIREGDEAIVGHTKAQQFKFYVDSTRSHVMKYKRFCTDMYLLPKEGSEMQLWQEDSEGRTLWPRRVPPPVVLSLMRNLEDVFKGIFGLGK